MYACNHSFYAAAGTDYIPLNITKTLVAGTKNVCYNIETIIDLEKEDDEFFFGLFHFTNTTKLKLMEYYGSRVTAASTPVKVEIVDTSVAG